MILLAFCTGVLCGTGLIAAVDFWWTRQQAKQPSPGWQARVLQAIDKERLREATHAVLAQDLAFEAYLQRSDLLRRESLARWQLAIAGELRERDQDLPVVTLVTLVALPARIVVRALGIEIVYPPDYPPT